MSKRILHTLLFPPAAVVCLGVPLGAALLCYAFLIAGEDTPIAYVSYLVSAYALVIFCARIVRLFQNGRAIIHRSPYLHRYLTDMPFKTRVSLYRALSINVLYAAFKLGSGVYFRSVWFITLAVYYGLLALMRFLLLRHVTAHAPSQNLTGEFRRSRLCGVILLGMTLVLSGVVLLVLHQGEGFSYGGNLIYAMAFYCFYTTITAVVRLVKYRRMGSPVLSASKAIDLTAALVSMLALETAMLSRFGAADDLLFRTRMIAATGAAVFALVLCMAVYMIVRSTARLRDLQT